MYKIWQGVTKVDSIEQSMKFNTINFNSTTNDRFFLNMNIKYTVDDVNVMLCYFLSRV